MKSLAALGAILLFGASAATASPNLDTLSEQMWADHLKKQSATLTPAPLEQWDWLAEKFNSSSAEDHQTALNVFGLILSASIVETAYFEAVHGNQYGYTSPLHEFVKRIDLHRHSEGLVQIAGRLPQSRLMILLIAVGNLRTTHSGADSFLNHPYIKGKVHSLLYSRFKEISQLSASRMATINEDYLVASLEYAVAIRSGAEYFWNNRLSTQDGKSIIETAMSNVFKNGSREYQKILMDMILKRYERYDLKARELTETFKQPRALIKIENHLPDRLFALALHDVTGFSAAYFSKKSSYAKWVLDQVDTDRFNKGTYRALTLERTHAEKAIKNCRIILATIRAS